MRLSRSVSRSRKLLLLGAAIMLAGLAGQASAGTTSSASPTPSSPPPSSSPAPAPAKKPAKAGKPATVKPAVRKPSGPAGSRITTGSKAVALTFDDGPDPVQTPKILKLLAQNHTHATFCLVGRNVQKHPELVRQIVAGGHTLCNHTWNHDLKLGKKPAAKIKADLVRTNAAIRAAAPNAKIKYFRAPGGNFTSGVVSIAKQLGMTSLYWKVDPRDWDHPKGETHAQHQRKVIRQVERHTKAGAIVLSHDYGQPDTIVAYRTLLPWLHKRYRLIGLP